MKHIIDVFCAVLDGSADITIYVIFDNVTNEKWYLFEEILDFHPQTYNYLYKCPDVNPRIYMIIDLIEKLCGGIRYEDGMMLSPHLLRNGRCIYHRDVQDIIGLSINDDFVANVLPINAPICNQEFWDTHLEGLLNATPEPECLCNRRTSSTDEYVFN